MAEESLRLPRIKFVAQGKARGVIARGNRDTLPYRRVYAILM